MDKQKKLFEHNEKEKCLLSGEEIDTRREKYKIVLDCDGDDILEIKFFRKGYYDSLFDANKEEVSNVLMKRTLGLAGGVLNKLKLHQSL